MKKNKPDKKTDKAVSPKGRRTTTRKRRMSTVEAIVTKTREMLHRTVDNLMEKENWDGIINILTPLIEDNKADHWARTQLGGIHAQREEYERAMNMLTDALALCYECSLAQWYFAVSLGGRGQVQDAIDILESMLEKGVWEMSQLKCECCGGLQWAVRMIANCKYALSKYYEMLEYEGLSRYYMELYKEDLRMGIQGNFKVDEGGAEEVY